MGDLSNFEIYKITNIATEGYIFSVAEKTTAETTYHYYMITFASNKQPVINKLNNTIAVLSSVDLEYVPVDNPSPEIMNFVRLVTSTITSQNPKKPTNANLKSINENDIKLIKTQ